jgi:hypothetical protein
MIDLFFVIFAFLRFFQKRIATVKYLVPIERVNRKAHLLARIARLFIVRAAILKDFDLSATEMTFTAIVTV